MSIGSVFQNNRTQSVRLPKNSRFPDDVKRVTVRVAGNERVLTPVGSGWDSFFQSDDRVTDDFLSDRATQEQAERESF